MSQPYDLSPLEATRHLLDISVTERQSFRSCRRNWILSVVENLEHKGEPTWAFAFGTAVHGILEQWELTRRRDDLVAIACEYLGTWQEEMEEQYRPMSSEVYEELQRYAKLGVAMMEHYATFDKQSTVQLGRILAVEGRFMPGVTFNPVTPEGYELAPVIRHESGRFLVPIVDPVALCPIERTINGRTYYPCMTARLDLLTQRRTPMRGLWVVDRKTATTARGDQALDFDDQLTGYCYTAWRWVGVVPRGAIIDELLKNEVKEPRWVRDETALSTARDQRTTPDMYREALHEAGLIRNGRITSERHAECLAALLARGWDPFYRRYEVTRTDDELLAFERQLAAEYEDMADVLMLPHKQYPNKTTRWCKSCGVKELCRAMDDGSDVESLRESLFVVGEDRKAVA